MISEEGVPVRGSMRDTDKPAALADGVEPCPAVPELGVSGCLRFEIFAGL